MKYVSSVDNHIMHTSEHFVENPKATVVLVHGMAEHRERYDAFFKKLVAHKYNVIGIDLRGHGESPVNGIYGHLKNEGGIDAMLQDMHQIISNIQTPVILLGHSFGSLLVRRYMHQYESSISGIILSGSPYKPVFLKGIKALLKFLAYLRPQKPAHWVASIMNHMYLKDIQNRKTSMDWLSFNESNIQQYIEDPLCGFPFTYQGYYDLMDLLDVLYHQASFKNKNTIPLLSLIGAHDPCPDFENGGYDAILNLLKNENYDVTSIVYNHSRHELLFDNENETVTQDIIHFMQSIV